MTNIDDLYRDLEHKAWEYYPYKTRRVYGIFNSMPTRGRLQQTFRYLPFKEFDAILRKHLGVK